jgi:hypothetical protein
MSRLLHPLSLTLLSGCVLGNERFLRPSELSPVWLVDRTRILAIQAEPPEILPGEAASFSALIPPLPGEEEQARIWLACPIEGGGIGFGCNTDLTALSETTDPAALAELGFIGFEPALPPVYTAPEDLLTGLSEAERREGAYVLAQLASFPLSSLESGDDTEDLDFSAVEVGYKRLVVSEAETPNHNPALTAFFVDEQKVLPGVPVVLDPRQPYRLSVELPEDQVERYAYVNPDGEREERVEEPYVAWFTTGGELLEEVTLYPYLEADFISPGPGQEGSFYAVVRDRRGGMSWLEQPWTTTKAEPTKL